MKTKQPVYPNRYFLYNSTVMDHDHSDAHFINIIHHHTQNILRNVCDWCITASATVIL